MKRLLAPLAVLLMAQACAVSTQQELQLGADYSKQINAQLPIVQDPEANRYLNVLGDSIARLADPRNLEWHFFIVDQPDINAFALPAGYIYVNRGLIQHATEMDELAGALGHEIGHVVKRHVVRQMQQQQGATVGIVGLCVLLGNCDNPVTSDVINVGASAVFAKFSRQDEAEADAEGVKNVVRAGIEPRGMAKLFQVPLDERKTQPSVVDKWFASHPMEEDRMAHVNALIAGIDPAVLATLHQDSPAYQAFRAHVMALPQTPAPASGAH